MNPTVAIRLLVLLGVILVATLLSRGAIAPGSLRGLAGRDGFSPVIAETYSGPTHARIERAVADAVRACPGLDRYGLDLKDEIAGTGPGAWITFDFAVVDRPAQLPPVVAKLAAGNRCHGVIDEERRTLVIGKSACHSICEGVVRDNDPDSQAREIELQP